MPARLLQVPEAEKEAISRSHSGYSILPVWPLQMHGMGMETECNNRGLPLSHKLRHDQPMQCLPNFQPRRCSVPCDSMP